MQDLDIRLAMLNPKIRRRMKELSISKGDQDILDCISVGEKTSSDIAAMLDCPAQTISVRLNALRKKGYLARQSISGESGGVQYEYRSIYTLY